MASQQEAERLIREFTGEYKVEENVYESGRKLLRELLLYIDARFFINAIDRKEHPYVSFKIHPSHIDVEFNDDGFTKSDLEHLCRPFTTVRQSTSRPGLNSVIKSTAKIYIHSGNFSLDLRLTTSEGKIRPTWVSPSVPLPDERTHMVIYFHDYGTEEDVARLKHVILAQFENLKAECLLFIKHLWRMTVEFYDRGGELRHSKQFRKLFWGPNRLSLKSAIKGQGEAREESQWYHVTSQQTGGGRDVTLAFPLTEKGKPSIGTGKKDISNVLACGNSDYSFLIDGDFEVTCQQQNFESSSPMNNSIHIWVTAAFLQAISEFRNLPNLCYEWPLFLPPIGHEMPLSREIRDMVQRNLLVKVHNQPVLRCMNEIRLIPDYFKDEKGQPLLALAAENLLLSPAYPERVVQVFEEHGAKIIEDETLLRLWKCDMRNQKPKMHQKDTTEEWHARMARFLLQFSKTSTFNDCRVKSEAVVPLKNGAWASMLFGPIFFPHTGDISIPESVDLRIVAPSATRDPDRYTLFKYLGVTEPSLDIARKSVLNSLVASDTIPLKLVNDCLQYLYLTHEASGWTRDRYDEVIVLTTDSTVARPQSNTKAIYLPGKGHLFSPENLLGPAKSESSLSFSFLHPEILSYVPTQGNSSRISWKRWLCDYVGLREDICLKSDETGKLSSDLLHIVSQNPEKLLDLLEYLLSKGEVELSSESAIKSEIRQLSASDLCDVEFTIELQDTWLPLKTLTDIVESYMEQPGQFPFLRYIEDDNGGISTKWNFLSEHRLVGKEDNLDFRLEILRSICRSDPVKDPIGQLQKVLDLYVSIYGKLTDSEEMTSSKERLKNFFDESGIVYFNGEELEWTSSSICLWDAPPDMVTRYSLKSCYELQGSIVQVGSALQNIFIKTLGIQNASLEHMVEELNELRISNDEDPTRILRIYEFLNTNIPSSQDIRTLFESSPLIFIPDGPYTGWHTSTEVLWSSNTDLCGMGTLDNTYESIRNFFVDKLGIKSLSLRILYDRLINSPKCKPQQMKEAIFILNDFLRSEPVFLDPQPVRNAEIFPVRDPDGRVSLRSLEKDFAIRDNDILWTIFERHISLLDFNLREFYRLKPFFGWLKLESRYLSKCVREDATVFATEKGLFEAPAVPIPYKKRNLKAMARYITRVAANFDSPYCRSGIKAFHKHLCEIECVQVWRINTFFILQQNGETFISESQISKAHIAEPDGRLRIYVPMDPASQDVCFRSVLPRKFATWIMQDPESSDRPHVDIEMVNALTAILASEATSLDEILDELGIARISYDGLSDDGDEATRQRISFKNVVERPRKADSPSFGVPVSN
ncbi:uncharacterized protein FPRO_12094 [Fusarium proliferatum ET1]|uniref:Uncharacterized protein n=1 Tax=Fusarium proliferatum (strain ET1) TaxID=1227346 RepID=A0A1L7W1W1_FUSPR|nr:uncharacterized protein FPRO_12094 [Fusarium proliferatum ET1]CZR46644.1 uncharacterized protein FPRO_12094 [Fusarium proliferatum ET1]